MRTHTHSRHDAHQPKPSGTTPRRAPSARMAHLIAVPDLTEHYLVGALRQGKLTQDDTPLWLGLGSIDEDPSQPMQDHSGTVRMVTITGLPDKPHWVIMYCNGRSMKRRLNAGSLQPDPFGASDVWPVPCYYTLPHNDRRKEHPRGLPRWGPEDVTPGYPLVLTSVCDTRLTPWQFSEFEYHGQLHYHAAAPDALWKSMYDLAEETYFGSLHAVC